MDSLNYHGNMHDNGMMQHQDGDGSMAPPGDMNGYEESELYQERPLPEGEYSEIHSLLVDGGNRYSASAVAFDGQEELLWVGNQGGHITSYYGLGMQKYTSFQVNQRNEVRQLLTIDSRVLSLTSDNLRCNTKFGRIVFDYNGESMHDMQCMLQTGPSSILLGGHQPRVVELDFNTQQEVRQVEVNEPGCAILKYSSKFIAAGDTSGKVTLRDPHTLMSQHVLEAHSGTISDFDIHGNQLITCGFSNRMGSLTVDRFLMVYDLRVMRAMSPMQVHFDPMFLRFVPTYSDRILVVSQTGQFQLLEQGAMTPSSMIMYQVHTEGAGINSLDISSSYQCMAFGDTAGYLHLFASGNDAVFSPYSTETEFPQMESVAPISISDELTPLSILPMQYPAHGKLLSDWPEEFCQKVYRKQLPIDQDILRTMKVVQNVGYAPNPGTRRRNQVMYKVRARRQSRERKASVPDSPIGRGEDPFMMVPKRYRKVEIKYSKLGVEDFDFRHYNKTNFAGLETHIPNAYCNAMLQVLYFLEPLRCALLSHICEKEFCLSCELGFLFHMFDMQKGKTSQVFTCQASNFLRAFRTIPEASALGLLLGEAEESMGKVNFARLIQNWSRFILQQVHTELVEAKKEQMRRQQEEEMEKQKEKMLQERLYAEGADASFEQHKTAEAASEDSSSPEKSKQPTTSTPKKNKGSSKEGSAEKDDVSVCSEGTSESGSAPSKPEPPKTSIISDLFGADVVNRFKCRCSEVMTRSLKSSLFDLIYPDISATLGSKQQLMYPFSAVVQKSMCLEQTTQAWCDKCNKYQPHVQTKILNDLPDVLVFNCHLENQRDFEFWKVQEELVPKIAASEQVPPVNFNVKMCRYGNDCTRKDCKFRHENDAERVSKVEVDPMAHLNDECTDPGWVPLGLKLRLAPNGIVEVENHDDETLADPSDGFTYYDIFASVAQIREGKGGGNLVSVINVGTTYHKRKENVSCTQWYLFNDFSITPVEKFEVVTFDLEWKIPCGLYFIRRDLLTRHDIMARNPIGPDVLYQNASLVTPRRKMVTFTPLDEEELPKQGHLVGIDAEFVTLNQEEAELRSDGTRSTIKPSQMSVARITCIRGQGSLEGEPFIDDYISTQEQVVDYLTQFSGIKPGDLDASISSKHLTTLKSTYNKLRYLVDAGVIFVGHGLKKDFRVINLVVPKDQVIDTVDLFHLPRQRMISLKFLAWFFLGINIQSVTHDSIEDARTAVKLYRKHQEMKEEGMENVRNKLKELYAKGRELQWKIPSDIEGSEGVDAGDGLMQD